MVAADIESQSHLGYKYPPVRTLYRWLQEGTSYFDALGISMGRYEESLMI